MGALCGACWLAWFDPAFIARAEMAKNYGIYAGMDSIGDMMGDLDWQGDVGLGR